jgi:hypothetical protein
MQATVYISTEAMATVNAIINLDYYDRVSLSDDPATDLTTSQGYYLNSNALHLAELPADADIALHITPADAASFHRHVSIPANLRGPIFSGAPTLPTDFAKKLTHWSPLAPANHHRGAVYYQNVLNSYCVNLTGSDDDSDAVADTQFGDGISGTTDTLLSDGVIVILVGLAAAVANMAPHQYVALTIPINAAMLGIELEGYRSAQEYLDYPAQQSETVYLRIADVLTSPDPDNIIISAIRNELSDYGYTY